MSKDKRTKARRAAEAHAEAAYQRFIAPAFEGAMLRAPVMPTEFEGLVPGELVVLGGMTKHKPGIASFITAQEAAKGIAEGRGVGVYLDDLVDDEGRPLAPEVIKLLQGQD